MLCAFCNVCTLCYTSLWRGRSKLTLVVFLNDHNDKKKNLTSQVFWQNRVLLPQMMFHSVGAVNLNGTTSPATELPVQSKLPYCRSMSRYIHVAYSELMQKTMLLVYH